MSSCPFLSPSGIIKAMDYRFRKQIIIGFLYLLLFAAIGFGIYYGFVFKAPSCTDNIKNQNEEEIDCGGPCEACIPFKDIFVIWAKALKAGSTSYDFAAKIRNPNPNFGTPQFHYAFVAKGQNGNTIGRREGQTFILPDSNKYIVESNFASNEPVATLELFIDKVPKDNWQKIQDYEALDIFVKDKNFLVKSDPQYSAEASATVKNNTSFGFDTVYVNIILFNINDQPLGASRTEIRTLSAGENRYFSTKWYWPPSDDVKSIDMQPETNVFAQENYMRIHTAP